MSILRALVQPCAFAVVTLLSACGVDYGGERCQRITLETDPATLPLGTISPVEERSFRQSEPFILGTPELGCCVWNPHFSRPSDCSTVNCDQLVGRLTVASVGGAFRNEPCGAPEFPSFARPGVGVCSVFLEGNKVVGVRAFCFD